MGKGGALWYISEKEINMTGLRSTQMDLARYVSMEIASMKITSALHKKRTKKNTSRGST